MTTKRVVLLVLDSLGIGELPDADSYGDLGSNTLGNTSRAVGGLKLKNLSRMGLGLIEGVEAVAGSKEPSASYGRMREVSKGKDTTTGHWEMASVVNHSGFATYPDGFPLEIMKRFSEVTGRGWLWGKAASGTEIIKKLGAEHEESGKPIVYTSADSVFQIAAHEDVIPLGELYDICHRTRAFLDEYNVSRVIARPFTGSDGGYERTRNRKDFSMEPPDDTLLDLLKASGREVIGIGKIPDIFSHRGFTRELGAGDNAEVIESLIEALGMGGNETGTLIFANLVDLDMLYGHRNDPQGYAGALEEIDKRLTDITATLAEDDILIITADHGCDPTTESTDHSREYVPLLVYGRKLKRGVELGTRESFSDIGKSVADYLGVDGIDAGTSFVPLVIP